MILDPNQAAFTVGTKLPALAQEASHLDEKVSLIDASLAELASSGIGEAVSAMPWELLFTGLGAVGAAMGAAKAWQEIAKHSSDEGAKKAAIKSAAIWEAADGSLLAYAHAHQGGLQVGIDNATSTVNKFISRADPRVLAVQVALALPQEERLSTADRFERDLEMFRKTTPKEAGVTRNYLTLARVAKTKQEQIFASERAASGALLRGEVIDSKEKANAYALLESSAALAASIEKGERPRDFLKPVVKSDIENIEFDLETLGHEDAGPSAKPESATLPKIKSRNQEFR